MPVLCRGYICDHCMSPSYVQPIGSVFTILGLIVLGPATYLPHNPWIDGPNHMSTTAGLCFMGIGTAALLVRNQVVTGTEGSFNVAGQRCLVLTNIFSNNWNYFGKIISKSYKLNYSYVDSSASA